MFDVRPVDAHGQLDLEKIKSIRTAARSTARFVPKIKKNLGCCTLHDVRQADPVEDEKRRFQSFIQAEKSRRDWEDFQKALLWKETASREKEANDKLLAQKNRAREERQKEREVRSRTAFLLQEKQREQLEKRRSAKERKKLEKKAKRVERKRRRAVFWENRQKELQERLALILNFGKKLKAQKSYRYFEKKDRKHYSFAFFAYTAAIFLLIFGVSFFYRSLNVRGLAIENGKLAYANLTQAKDEIKSRNFEKASLSFDEAYERFSAIQENVDGLGKILVEASRFVPYLSKLSTGSHLAEAGKDISRIGELASDTLSILNQIKNPLKEGESISFLKIFEDSNKNIEEISLALNDLEDNLDKINLEDIPENERSRFADLKQKLPEINQFMTGFSEEEKILTDVFGGNGPRKYLFLFQNNQEMRATGGFIGTYAVLDIFNGNIKNFFVDGIFNPDGQLREKIIPPAPIQKISATWSLHDSNWFPDFPTSAEKASWFYEKTGGPTVDGVITMTPTVMQKLLEITGPIEMPEYNLTIDKDNFLENIQTEVEVNYDKELNQPKKVLADLAPLILDRIFNARGITDLTKTMDVLLTSLNEKQILIYSKNYAIEKIISENGWSGEVLDTRKDYLSVINTNINGYKTDGVIDETISHKAQIQSDGSIIDTVAITRHHNGGNTPYDWWNKVNADYMRVYVPKGAKLISVSGQTKEFNSPPLDYQSLGFKHDPQVGMEDDSAEIDSASGTKIYEDSGKTVFANWVYVSPQESTTITYSYLLPFKLDTNLTANPADAYSILFQKQSGSLGSAISSVVTYPESYKIIWQYPENIASSEGIKWEDRLNTDKFIGVAFGKNQ